jgi:hypothetical protein
MAILALLLVTIRINAVWAATIVSPDGFQNVEGDSAGGPPTSFTRVQYLYPASDFSSLSKHQIIGIAWRPDEATGALTTSADSFTVRLSTTAVTELSTVFADNIGQDEKVVFEGSLTITTAAEQLPRGFDFAVQFQTPFRYDPDQGNLLVEFTTSGFDSGGWRVDNRNVFSGPITLVQSGNPSATVASGTFRTLAVMQFTYIAEPTGQPGDFNGDRTVDVADYVVWRNALGITYTQADYEVWRSNFGKTAGSGATGYPLGASAQPLAAEVPEPTTAMISLATLTVFLGRRSMVSANLAFH